MSLRPEAERWLAVEEENREIQRREAHLRAEAWRECERGIGHSLTVGSDVCVTCGNRVPGADDHEYELHM